MSTATTVSVALCTFNSSRYLREQLRSIADQSRLPDELVVADDGSTDETLDIIEEFASVVGFPVRVLEPGGHLGVARNFERAILATTGQIIVLSDHDDAWLPDRIEVSVAALSAGVLAVHGDADIIDDAGTQTGDQLMDLLMPTPDERRAMGSGALFPALLKRNLATGATMALRRELFDACRPFPAAWVHDEWLAISAAVADGLRFVDRPLIRYRLHGGNVIGASKPTFGHNIRQVLKRDSTRNAELAERATQLVARWDALASLAKNKVTSDVLRSREADVRGKASFEAARAQMGSRPTRLPRVARLAVGGKYRKFASQGWLDIVRDLLQPR